MKHKGFKNIEDQLSHLQSKGLEVEDKENAKAFLYLTNYYRLSGYWYIFKKQGKDTFIDGTTFEQVKELYEFDYHLRLFISEATKSIEIVLRTQLAYHLAEFDSPTALENPENFFSNSVNYYQNMGELGRLMSQQADKACIKHHINERAQRPPIWASVEIMTFGLLSRFLKDVRHAKVQKNIAKVFGLNAHMIISLVEHAVVLRNLSAHHSRLWNATLKIRFKPQVRANQAFLYENLNLQKDVKGNFDNRIYNSLVVLAYTQDKLYPTSKWSKRLKALINGSPDIDYAQMGFPADWKHRSLWKD